MAFSFTDPIVDLNMDSFTLADNQPMDFQQQADRFEVSLPALPDQVQVQPSLAHVSQVPTSAPMEVQEEKLIRKTRKALRDEANGVHPKESSNYGPIKKPREKNKQKHNESEARRRSRLRDKFFELRDAAHVNKKDRFNILTQAISRLQEYEDRIAELEEEKASILSSPTKDTPAPKTEIVFDKAVKPVPMDVIHSPVMDNIPAATVALDGRLQDCNAAFSQLTHYQPDNLSAASLFSLTHPVEMMETFATVKRLLTGETRVWEAVRTIVDAKGGNHSVHQTLTTICLNGKPSHYLLMLVPKPLSQSASPQVQLANAVVVGTAAAVGLGLTAQSAAAPLPYKSVSGSDQVLGLESAPMGLAF